MVSQVLRREKLNQSELLTNFPRLIQAWAGPPGDITVAPREAAAAAAPACHSCICVVCDRLLGRGLASCSDYGDVTMWMLAAVAPGWG